MKFTYAADARPVDGFTIRRGIHRGGFGEVYYAVSDAGKEVALKLLTHDLDTELRGIRQCLNLKHPNLVTLFDVKTDSDGDQWVVMEYVNGSNLEEVLTAFPQGLPIREVTDWLSGIVNGVEYLHDRGLIHRDLKPANIYRENGVVKIGDVGLSKRFDGERRHQHTESIGTVYYMAPEITHGKYGPAVDVYSLGIILYELLTGRLPFNGETSGEILMKQLSAAPDLSAVSANLRPVLAHALEKDPQKRTSSVRQLWEEFAATLSPTAIPDSHFLNGHTPSDASQQRGSHSESARKDTDRNGDTGRKNQPSSPPQSSIAYEAGKLLGTVLAPPPRTVKSPQVTRPGQPDAQRKFWGAKLAALSGVGIALLLPWDRYSPRETLVTVWMIVCGAGLFSFLLWARESWRQADVSVWKPTLFSSRSRHSKTSSPQILEADWSGTFAVGSLAAVLFVVVGELVIVNFSERHDFMTTPARAVFLAAVSVIGCWAVGVCRWLTERLPWSVRHPRLMYAIAGLTVATAANALDEFLMIDIGPAQRLAGRAAFDHLGVNPLRVEPHGEPAWLGYTVFFCGVFFLLGKRFETLQNTTRPRRWRLWPVIVAALASVLWTHVFEFPQLLGLLWVTTIVAAAQVAAPWQPKLSFKERN